MPQFNPLGAFASTAGPVIVPSEEVCTGRINVPRRFLYDPQKGISPPIAVLPAIPYPVGLQTILHAPATPMNAPGRAIVYRQNSERSPTYTRQASALLATPPLPVSGSPGC